MIRQQYEVGATGEVGQVYTTKTGMEMAKSPECDSHGWEQVTLTKRVRVESIDCGSHQRWWVWRRVRKEQS